MINQKFNFPSCSATAGKPFEKGPKCPLYLRTDQHLKSEGWTQVYYNTFKTGSGDLCNTKYKRLEKSRDKTDMGVLSMLEVNIEGTKSTCTLTAVICTYLPGNILKTIDHECEGVIMKSLELFWKTKPVNNRNS